jgi:hypothetical protein
VDFLRVFNPEKEKEIHTEIEGVQRY